MTIHETYINRCLALASQGAGYVAPNPMVGAVLVHDNRIIGEGYHEKYGHPHAEVNCINAVAERDQELIRDATLYVSLEPCAHFGKTPPCADLIICHQIKNVFVGCRDPFPDVNGKGIEKLISAGVDVLVGVLESECRKINKRFFTFHTQHRPYIILKWAETADRKVGNQGDNRLMITNEYTNKMVHKWRSEEATVMAGTNTVMLDDPQLTNRFWNGAQPTRVVIDMDLRLPSTLHVFDRSVPTIVFNSLKHEEARHLLYYQVTRNVSLVHQVVNGLKQLKILSVMVEGGTRLLQSFLDEGMWDEARVLTNTQLIYGEGGVAAPILENARLHNEYYIENDLIKIYLPG